MIDNVSIGKGTRVPLLTLLLLSTYVLNDFRNRHECNGSISDDTECCWSDGSTDLVNITDSKDKNNWKKGAKHDTFYNILI